MSAPGRDICTRYMYVQPRCSHRLSQTITKKLNSAVYPDVIKASMVVDKVWTNLSSFGVLLKGVLWLGDLTIRPRLMLRMRTWDEA